MFDAASLSQTERRKAEKKRKVGAKLKRFKTDREFDRARLCASVGFSSALPPTQTIGPLVNTLDLDSTSPVTQPHPCPSLIVNPPSTAPVFSAGTWRSVVTLVQKTKEATEESATLLSLSLSISLSSSDCSFACVPHFKPKDTALSPSSPSPLLAHLFFSLSAFHRLLEPFPL